MPNLHLRQTYEKALNLLFPPQCAGCNTIISRFGALCGECWKQIRFITAPFCDACGWPFDYTLGEGALCARCIHEPPPYAHARAVFQYDIFSRTLVLALKFNDQHQLAQHFARWMAQAGAELLQKADIIIPVPLHKKRFIKRRYNQSALLARALSDVSDVPCMLDGLLRIRPTLSQSGLSRKERLKNLKGAFAVNAKMHGQLQHKNIVLIDDVMTTGATLAECALALQRAGCAEVNALTLSRRT